jgi:predicted membrane protein
MYQSLSGIFDASLIVVCSLLIQLLQSRVAAIVLMVYAALNVILVLVQTGRLGGWWIAVVGVYAIIYTFKFQKAWKAYKNGDAPDINLPQ